MTHISAGEPSGEPVAAITSTRAPVCKAQPLLAAATAAAAGPAGQATCTVTPSNVLAAGAVLLAQPAVTVSPDRKKTQSEKETNLFWPVCRCIAWVSR